MLTDGDLPAASSLLSSRWSRDSLLTGHPSQLYDGRVLEHIDEDALERLIRDLERTRGPLHVGAGRMGVFTWDIACVGTDGPFTLQIPLVLDERGTRGRAKRDVPGQNVDNMRAFRARGLGRFVLEPLELTALPSGVPAALFAPLPDHRPVSFGHGSLHVELAEDARSWLVSLGPRATADLLAEMIAALVYHYDPDEAGGTAITDVCINDGDFVVARRRDGSFAVRLTAARRRESGIRPSLLLLYLLQMMAYEDWAIDGKLVGLPTLVGNPSVAFAGLARGVQYRCHDLGQPAEEARRRALGWIRDFGRSAEGRSYRPWVERFLDGRLPPTFGDDPRDCWWRLVTLKTRLGVLELRARQDPTANEPAARALRPVIDRLSRAIGQPPDDERGTVRVNDLGRAELLGLLEEARFPPEARDAVADELFARWPFRGVDHLLAAVPGAQGLRRLKSKLSFGRVVADEEQGTLAALPPAPASGGAPRPLANPETYGNLAVPPALHAAAVQTFPTFEAYMDAALHDPGWGYYARRVSIGRGGHFITNPESLSPDYGRWIATRAFRFWEDMRAHGELADTDPFPLVEFGAGNGRLARDVLDAVAHGAATDERRRVFADRLAYRIYETSPGLRDRQRALLGADAIVAEGDARRPAATLARDFPGGLKGLVVTNEVPDAFGVHKVVMRADTEARIALVVPRVEPALRDAVGDALAHGISGADACVRRTFGFAGNAGDLYLDGDIWREVMAAVAALPSEAQDAALGALWFEEAYVPVAAVPELAAHLAANAAPYTAALAAEPSGVVVYVNVHAGRFIRELGAHLKAGFVVTIDYGDTTTGLIQGARRGEFPFRVYGEQEDFVPRPNHPYTQPGRQDLTADVNFTDLAQAAQDVGLEVVHYGPERDLVGSDLPALLKAAANDDSAAEFLGNPVFKVLVLGTRQTTAFADPDGSLLSPLPVFPKRSRRPVRKAFEK